MTRPSGIDQRGRDWIAIGLWFVLAVLAAFLLFSAGWWMARETHDVGKTGSYASAQEWINPVHKM